MCGFPASLLRCQRIPQPHCLVARTGNQTSPIGAEGKLMDVTLMTLKIANQLVRADVPEANCVVGAAARQSGSIWTES